jgi:Methylamine utilisation protein MauE
MTVDGNLGAADAFGVGLVFAASGFGKLVAPSSVASFLEALNVWVHPARVGIAIGLIELATAAAIMAGFFWAPVVAIGLLMIFSGGLVAVLVRGRRARCGCFGDVTSSPVGPMHILRNLVLVGLAGAAIGSSDRPLRALPAGVLLAVLCILTPEFVTFVRDLHTVARREVALTRGGPGATSVGGGI